MRSRSVVIVEGYTDVMACRFSGIKNAVAACGTAFGLEHAQMVRRLIRDDAMGKIQFGSNGQNRVIFAFDGDEAGKKATLKATSLDSAFLSQTFVARSENGMDPCEIRMAEGEEGVRKLIRGARPIYDFIMDGVLQEFEAKEDVEKAAAVKSCSAIVSSIKDSFLRELYSQSLIRKLSRLMLPFLDSGTAKKVMLSLKNKSLDNPELNSRVSSLVRGAIKDLSERGAGDGGKEPSCASAAPERGAAADPVFSCEQALMAQVVQRPSSISPSLWERLSERSFRAPVFKSFFTFVEACGGPGGAAGKGRKEWVETLSQNSPSLLYPTISALANLPLPEAKEGYADSLVAKILELDVIEKEAECREELSKGSGKVEEVLSRIQELEKEKRDLKKIMEGPEGGRADEKRRN